MGCGETLATRPLTAALLLLPVACPAPLSPARLPTREAGFSLSQSRAEATARFGWATMRSKCKQRGRKEDERAEPWGRRYCPFSKFLKAPTRRGYVERKPKWCFSISDSCRVRQLLVMSRCSFSFRAGPSCCKNFHAPSGPARLICCLMSGFRMQQELL